ncbi:MAG: transcriptional repressor [Clostridiales bacterium]|jgi:Fur family peroxide stress response transcriptional regulator|nr:transcriptional repressor [Clostridiales bacterium]
MHVISERLKEKKLKLTPQRLAIYKFLYNTTTHPTAEGVYKELSETHPSMSLATVYKTLDSLKKVNLVQELNVGESSFRYDARCDFHIHLICRSCNEVYDLPALPSFEALKEEVSHIENFNVEYEQVFFYGSCSECSAKIAEGQI